MLTKFNVCFIAGIGAGLGTGFAGMSAAAVISPMLITFLDIPALSSDVLASAVSAYTYGKHKNLDIKNGIVMMISVLCFTLVGSYASDSHQRVRIRTEDRGRNQRVYYDLYGIYRSGEPLCHRRRAGLVVYGFLYPVYIFMGKGGRQVCE